MVDQGSPPAGRTTPRPRQRTAAKPDDGRIRNRRESAVVPATRLLRVVNALSVARDLQTVTGIVRSAARELTRGRRDVRAPRPGRVLLRRRGRPRAALEGSALPLAGVH